MKKKVTAIILVLLMLLPALPVMAAEYRDQAMSYLVATYNVPAERIELFDGGSITLEHIDEAFWMAKFTILPEGTTARDEPQELPPDAPVSDRGLLIDEDYIDDGSVYGAIYILEKTGEIINQTDMDAYFLEERELAGREWERLSKEAGKLDVPLYQKLQTISASEKTKVMILPIFVESQELKDRFVALKAEYPQYSEGMPTLSEMFQYGYAVTLPMPTEARDLPAEIMPLPADDGGELEQAGAGSSGSTGSDLRQSDEDETYWIEHELFQNKLESIRLDGIRPAIAEITAKLDSLGVDYDSQSSMIVAELTAAQIKEIAQLSQVQNIYEDMIYTTMDGAAEDLLRQAAPAFASDTDATNPTSPYYWLLIIPFAILAAVLLRKRLLT